MKKDEMIEALESAKSLHMKQMNKIEAELSGKKVKEPTPLSKMECACGLWFYKNEALMLEYLGAQLFERLDRSHEQWHKTYTNIYDVFLKEERNRGLFSKMLASKQKDKMNLDKAKYYYSELQHDTEELFNVSDSALRRVSALSESKFHD
jgi:hypothetical protein